MKIMNILPFKVLAISALALALNGCSDELSESSEPVKDVKYSAVVCVGSWPNTAYYIADVPSLKEGQISLKGSGAEMTGKVYAQDVIQKDGFYYHANFGSGRFGKYHVQNGALIVDKEVPFTFLNWSSYVWADDQTLVIFGTAEGEARYAIVKVADMTLTTGKLNLEAYPKGFDEYAIGFAEFRDSKLFIGFSFTTSTYSANMPVYQKFGVAVVNYPGMNTESIISDTRTTTPGGPVVYAPASFQDENGDIYFISDPVYNYDYKSPSSIYRIKKGATQLDNTYYFDFSSKVENGMGPAMWYLGNGKAIVRTRVKGINIDAEHSFSVIDIRNGAFIKKLDLPADKGERMVKAVIVEDGKAYIAVNAADKDYIWEYDPATEALKPGAEFVGGMDYILRLEKVK
ncbi:DUF4374 domain-containing protein [Dyadobacter sp. CY343]|uniref:DUF4374 domain-containing protein n=1 Tax=Dyadobacter sp. CY343 TaxID=2907299 RepID=UPI001F1BEBE3|nr:DUF4374 domain-containing protein [Dyadobacter sp. CY343]MCE7060712.1 DUF4374 domain-containing protein [Dyadobacter sp. CY343]